MNNVSMPEQYEGEKLDFSVLRLDVSICCFDIFHLIRHLLSPCSCLLFFNFYIRVRMKMCCQQKYWFNKESMTKKKSFKFLFVSSSNWRKTRKEIVDIGMYHVHCTHAPAKRVWNFEKIGFFDIEIMFLGVSNSC